MTYIIYHKDCMDGVSSASIAEDALSPEALITLIPLQYIKDRDLWLWKMTNSKEFNEALAFLVIPNDTISFKQVLLKSEFSELVELGKILIEKQSRQVQSKLTKVADLSLCNIDLKVINVTENISELGNAICTEYNKPALMYFITQDMKVICSLRSTNDLPDVSTIAVTFGGGGHRNACGFTVDLQTFVQNIIKTVKE